MKHGVTTRNNSVKQSGLNQNPANYLEQRVYSPMLGVILRVYHSDDPLNSSATNKQDLRGAHAVADVLIVNDGGHSSLVMKNVTIPPSGNSGFDDFHECLPKGTTGVLDNSEYDSLQRNVNPQTLDGDWCLAPGTRLLCSDLKWKPIETLSIGDELIGFDETIKNAKLRPSIIENIKHLNKPCIQITTEKGVITSSEDHMWVVSGSKPKKFSRMWKKTSEIQVGDKIAYYTDPWEYDDSREGGYVAGFIDGEGFLSTYGGGVGWGQNPGDTSNKIQKLVTERGFTFSKRKGTNKCEIFKTLGNGSNVRFLGMFQPERLMARSRLMWENRRNFNKTSKPAVVLEIKHVGIQPVVAVQTSTRTFIAEGYLSHNCVVSFIGGKLSQPFIVSWWPHPFNRTDPATSSTNGNSLAQGRRYFKRYRGVKHVITDNGNVYLDTNEANSTIVPGSTPSRKNNDTGGDIHVDVKPTRELEINFNNIVDNTDEPSLPQANPSQGSRTRQDTSTRVTLDKDQIELIAGEIAKILARTGNVEITAGTDVNISPTSKLNFGGPTATEPMVLGTQWQAAMTRILLALVAHNHSSPVGPTSPPLNAPAFSAEIDLLTNSLSQFIFGKATP